MREGEEEKRGRNGGAEILSLEKYRVEQDERCDNRGIHYRSEERSGNREISRDLQR